MITRGFVPEELMATGTYKFFATAHNYVIKVSAEHFEHEPCENLGPALVAEAEILKKAVESRDSTRNLINDAYAKLTKGGNIEVGGILKYCLTLRNTILAKRSTVQNE